MTHPRIALRVAIKDQLLARPGVTAIVGQRVMMSRYKDLVAERELPAVRIYTHSEEIEEDSWDTAPREYKRRLMCVVEALVRVPNKDADELADRLDALCWEVEKAMGADDTLNDTATDVNLARSTIEVEIEGENSLAIASMFYRVDYTTCPAIEPDELENFDEAHVAFNLANEQDEDDQMRDEITNIHGA